MRVTSAFGGTHRKSLVEGAVWYQSFENRMLLLDPRSGAELVDIEFAPRGTTGVVSDFELVGSRLWVVLEDDWLLDVDVSTPREPKVAARWGRADLGIRPRFVSAIGSEIYVSGDGGALRLSDVKKHAALLAQVKDEADPKKAPTIPPRPVPALEGRVVGRVVEAKDGPVACVGRRIVRLADGAYLGSASTLIPLPREAGGGFGFVLQSSDGAQVGLMDEEFRERSASALRGRVHAIRTLEGRFVAVNDFEVATWKLVPRTPAATSGSGSASAGDDLVLGPLLSVPVKGARDVARAQPNRFAVAGTFGRALYRYLPEGDKPGDTFYWSRRLPGRLEVAATDRRRILAASREGSWLYLIGEEAEVTDAQIASPDTQVAAVDTAWGSARIVVAEPGSAEAALDTVEFRMGERGQSYTLQPDTRANTLCAADGKVWIGHTRGIDVIGFDPVARQVVLEDRIRLDGPMVALYPNRVGGGVSYVAAFSGFGVVRPVDVDAPPIATKGTRSAFDPLPAGDGGKDG